MRGTVLVYVTLGSLAAGPSYGACTKPEAPSCATQTGRFVDEADYDRCRMQMITYKGQMEQLVSCHQQEGQSAADQQAAQDELENQLSQFNRRARGEQ